MPAGPPGGLALLAVARHRRRLPGKADRPETDYYRAAYRTCWQWSTAVRNPASCSNEAAPLAPTPLIWRSLTDIEWAQVRREADARPRQTTRSKHSCGFLTPSNHEVGPVSNLRGSVESCGGVIDRRHQPAVASVGVATSSRSDAPATPNARAPATGGILSTIRTRRPAT